MHKTLRSSSWRLHMEHTLASTSPSRKQGMNSKRAEPLTQLSASITVSTLTLYTAVT